MKRVSVPSFGDSFFIQSAFINSGCLLQSSFRPLIRGFFFYMKNENLIHHRQTRFRPLIRGFFFYSSAVSTVRDKFYLFPSPHSGILFL